ncbi:MAG: hypothetical protein V1721_05835, partial [Pseudomonadota bacterium]
GKNSSLNILRLRFWILKGGIGKGSRPCRRLPSGRYSTYVKSLPSERASYTTTSTPEKSSIAAARMKGDPVRRRTAARAQGDDRLLGFPGNRRMRACFAQRTGGIDGGEQKSFWKPYVDGPRRVKENVKKEQKQVLQSYVRPVCVA